ncbi:MAG: glycoside hydrolase family 25 protein, partial [Rhizobium rosettiformans]
MRWLSILLLPACLAVTACTSGSYDLLETSAVSPRFHDTDPQHFDGKTPHRHEVHGIDVSKWNGDVDWRQVKKSGVSFVFIKATEGKDRIDPRFREYWEGAKAAGIPHAA